MNNKETLQNYNTRLGSNNTSLDDILQTINNLPDKVTTQDKSVEITENGTTTVTPDEGYQALSRVNVTTNVASSGGGFEINNGEYLFQNDARVENLNDLLPLCKNLISTYYMFYNAKTIDTPIKLGHGKIDTITTNNSYSYMFYGCAKIPSIVLESTSAAPTTLYDMFYGCTNLTNVTLLVNTSSVSNAENMFYNCTNLQVIDLSHLNLDKATTIRSMFYNCKSLESVDASFINPQQLVYNGMGYAFYGCANLRSILLPDFTTYSKSTIDISYLFGGCDHLTEVNLSAIPWDKVSSMSSLFGSSANNPDTTIEGTLDVDLSVSTFPKITTGSGFFNLLRNNKCVRTIKLDGLSGKKFSSNYLQQFCQNASSLIELTLPAFDTSTATNGSYMFENCVRLKTLTGLENLNTSSMTTIYHMFYNCKLLTELDVSTFNTAKVVQTSSNPTKTGYHQLFANCSSIRVLDLSKWVIHNNNYSMGYMFDGCTSLESILLPSMPTHPNLTGYSCMFRNCTSLKSIDLSVLNLSTFRTTMHMFENCTSLESVSFGTVDTPLNAQRQMEFMFKDCTSLKAIDLSFVGDAWDSTYSGSKMTSMFEGCTSLTLVNLQNLKGGGRSVNMNKMFKDCTSLTDVIFNDDVSYYSNSMSIPQYMFHNCTSLEVLDLHNVFKGNMQINYAHCFENCRKLRKLDLRGNIIGQLGPGSSYWQSGGYSGFKDCGVDNTTPTIVYTDTEAKQNNIIKSALADGLNWSTENVIVASLDEVVDMT